MLVASLGLFFLFQFISQEDTIHWGYEGEEGPAHWGELNKDWELCRSGSAQSPINIDSDTAIDVDLVNIEFDYGETTLNIFNNGHTIQVNVDKGSSITYNGIQYNLLQFHFHAPSEHERDGQQSDMEIHFVHQDANSDNLAVVAILMEAGGAENSAYSDIFRNLPAEKGEPAQLDIMINLRDLLPEGAKFYTYQGSLTTPPCSETVRWLIQDTTVELSSDQISAFTDIYDGNARPVQNRGERDLLHDAS